MTSPYENSIAVPSSLKRILSLMYLHSFVCAIAMMKASRIVNRVTAVSAIRRLTKPTCITGIRKWNVKNFSTQLQEHEHEWQEFSNSQTAEKNLNSNNPVSNVSSEPIRTSLLMELTDRVGVLHDVLRFFWKYDVNISRYVALMYLDT